MNKALQILHSVRQQLEQQLDFENSECLDCVKDGRVSAVVWDDNEVENCQETGAAVKPIFIEGMLLSSGCKQEMEGNSKYMYMYMHPGTTQNIRCTSKKKGAKPKSQTSYHWYNYFQGNLVIHISFLHCLQRFYHNIDHWGIKLYRHTNFHTCM